MSVNKAATFSLASDYIGWLTVKAGDIIITDVVLDVSAGM